ncbi:hypothetical protein ACWCPX_17670 [Streptomyces olivaceoviridis]
MAGYPREAKAAGSSQAYVYFHGADAVDAPWTRTLAAGMRHR